MSGEALKWARTQSFGSSTLKAMVNGIAVRADKNGSTWASQRTLAADLGLSERRVRSRLALLQSLGVIVRKRRSAGPGKGRLTDNISLALKRKFDLTASDVREAKANVAAAATTGPRVPLERRSYNRTLLTLTTGQWGPGDRKGATYPYQGERLYLTGYSTAPGGPRLTVLEGGLADDGRDDQPALGVKTYTTDVVTAARALSSVTLGPLGSHAALAPLATEGGR